MSFVFHFAKGLDINQGADVLGNKGANLAKMAGLGFNVPAGFIISSKLCEYYYSNDKSLPPHFDEDLKKAVADLEQVTGKKFGGVNNPLLVSVRSGATVSMPGMMETILNVGLNDETVQALALKTNERFALDSYRRFLQMYGSCVLHTPSYLFESYVRDLDFKNIEVSKIQEVIDKLKKTIGLAKLEGLSDVHFQLKNSVLMVLDSWTFEKAITYRKIYNIPESLGTAIVVQAMVFGNMNSSSGTGVVFSRNPVNGNKELYGEFLLSAQGEDVVSGEHNPISISDLSNPQGLLKNIPDCYNDLLNTVAKLESHFRDMQDIEFTIEDNKLYILQTRSGKRSSLSSIKIAVDMANEGIISKQEAIKRVDPESLSQLMHLFVDYSCDVKVIGKGLPASPGSACGIVAFTSDEAEKISSHSSVILVRQDTSPEDIKGMHHSSGILTSRGGMTSHAAVVARGMGKPCISGAAIKIDMQNKTVQIGNITIGESDYITIDGSSGNIILGKTELIAQKLPQEFDTFMSWVDEFRRMRVRANAENVLDIQTAIKFGAEGIGLCRTEHMLFEKERLNLIRQIVIENDLEKKIKFISKLFILHKQDFKEILALSAGLPVNIRLLDPPLHEFLPFEDFENIAKSLKIGQKELEQKIQAIAEKNPMLGHRGCRLGVTLPELYQMQVRAILEAAIEVKRDKNISFDLEIMLPFIATVKELEILLEQINNTAQIVQANYNCNIDYKIGIMIELPRAALIAEKLAPLVQYFSFGTNDLTQMTYGLSRDDMSYFAQIYKDQGIFINDPFSVLDEEGVAELIRLASTKGKGANSELSLSVCGEHGGDPRSIKFFNDVGLNYVSCSPFRIIIAKLAAAQANL